MHAPITALWAGLLGIVMLYLAGRVVQARSSENVVFGDGGNAILIQRQRVHGNFVEYVPLGVLLLVVGGALSPDTDLGFWSALTVPYALARVLLAVFAPPGAMPSWPVGTPGST